MKMVKMINKYRVLLEAVKFDGTMDGLEFLNDKAVIDNCGILHFFDGLAENTIRKGDYLSIGKLTNHIHVYRAGSLTEVE